MSTQPRTRKTPTEVPNELHEIKEALLGGFEKPGLIHEFSTFRTHIEAELTYLKRSLKTTQDAQKADFDKIKPVIELVGNWKFLVGFIIGAISFIYFGIHVIGYIKQTP